MQRCSMDDAEDSATLEKRSPKRARLQDLDASQLNRGSYSAEATAPASRQPAVHTRALRSVLKGTRNSSLCMFGFSTLLRCTEFILLLVVPAVFVVKAGMLVH